MHDIGPLSHNTTTIMAKIYLEMSQLSVFTKIYGIKHEE